MLTKEQGETKMKGHVERDKDRGRHIRREEEERDYCLLDNREIMQNKDMIKGRRTVEMHHVSQLPLQNVPFNVCSYVCVFFNMGVFFH